MLQITMPACESYNEKTGTFANAKEQTIQLEHSLVSVSKWEGKWKKPFLGATERTYEEGIDYIRCMTITQNVSPEIYYRLSPEQLTAINEYIEAPMTATWFSEKSQRTRPKEIVTAEIIYYWMIALEIPPEYQKWHLNRLLTLIRVCNAKNAPQKKTSKRETARNNRALNAARRSVNHSSG
ncbi:MAG TPA: hypothetical protein PKN45_12490 [Candidatus Limiplasma sp.]|nr:hypothetical protein [Candidatus Limiplasma sp.]